MSTIRRNNEATTASWPKQTAKRVMAWWQMDELFFLISYKEIYRQAQRCRQIHLPVLPRAPGTTWAVDWVSLCPDVRAVSAQAFLSLSAGLSLNPLCQDWINWAAGHLDCFPSGKESHVVQRHFGGWERVKSNRKTNSLNQRGTRKHGEGHTMTAGQVFHPARLARAASELWPEGSWSTEHKGLETEWPGQEAQVNWERSSREALMVPSLLSLGTVPGEWVPPTRGTQA